MIYKIVVKGLALNNGQWPNVAVVGYRETIAGIIMQLIVTNITHNRVICGDNGNEVDDYFPSVIMSHLQ